LAGHSAAALASLVATLGDPDEEMHETAVEVLGDLGPAVIPTMLGLLSTGDAAARRSACEVLEEIEGDSPEALQALVGALGDSEKEVREAARFCLSVKEGPAIPFLLEGLRSADAVRRRAVCETLSDMFDDARPALPALKAALKDPDPKVREAAEEAIDAIEI
jgi:HEAT repeat protein